MTAQLERSHVPRLVVGLQLRIRDGQCSAALQSYDVFLMVRNFRPAHPSY
jgi:hypothetical protein